MRLDILIDSLQFECLSGDMKRDISDVVFDSRLAKEGTLFVAINGFKTDSHRFLPQVAASGAAAVVVEKNWEELEEEAREALGAHHVSVLKVDDGREALALLSAALFGHPTRELTVVGITGTKGKTTTTHMLAAILKAAGYQVGAIGTGGIWIGDTYIPSDNTTPEPYYIQRYARQMVDAGCQYLVMEASSTGIKYHRTDGIEFDLGLFTNISPDHIGTLEHPDFEDYLANKAKLFTRCRRGIFNRDDPHFPDMTADAGCRIQTFGVGQASGYDYPDIYAAEVRYEKREGVLGSHVKVAGSESFDFFVSMPGDFNVCNAMGAVSAARALGVEIPVIQKALGSVKVAARVETLFSNEDVTIILDYAHNGVSASALLSMLRSYDPGRIVVIFGAEGDRAQIRRQEMGETCGQLADFCVLSSQNPGDEPIENIFRDIHEYLDPSGTPSVDIPDRREAIRYVLRHARKGDIIAVIGKGDEDYELVKGEKIPYLDREEIRSALQELGWI